MCKEAFSKRLVQLRMAKGVSARDMSLSLGQNPGYNYYHLLYPQSGDLSNPPPDFISHP